MGLTGINQSRTLSCQQKHNHQIQQQELLLVPGNTSPLWPKQPFSPRAILTPRPRWCPNIVTITPHSNHLLQLQHSPCPLEGQEPRTPPLSLSTQGLSTGAHPHSYKCKNVQRQILIQNSSFHESTPLPRDHLS